jgi:pimeloyl-ACP methyl ester carboxylesterase
MHRLTTRHGRVAYTQAGNPNGVHLLMLHNGGTDHSIWEPVTKALGGRYHITAIDWLGYGESTALQEGRALDIYADVIADVIDHLALSEVVLVGNCVGAAAAIHFARQDAEREPAARRVTQLVLFNVLTSSTLALGSRMAARVLTTALGRRAMQAFSRLITQRDWGRGLVVGFQLKAAGMVPINLRTQLADRYRQPSNADALMALGGQVFLGFGFEALDQPCNGMPPAMVIWGKHNQVLSVAKGRKFIQRYQPAQHHIEHGGHLLMMEAPQRCAELIADFVSEKESS